MSKYEPLERYLVAQRAAEIPLTFGEIEAILGAELPRSARSYPAWWSNDRSNSNHTQSRSWMEAGYRTSHVDLSGETVTFVREAFAAGGESGAACRHPLYGALRGLLTIAPGVDLTDPADPAWADNAERSAARGLD